MCWISIEIIVKWHVNKQAFWATKDGTCDTTGEMTILGWFRQRLDLHSVTLDDHSLSGRPKPYNPTTWPAKQQLWFCKRWALPWASSHTLAILHDKMRSLHSDYWGNESYLDSLIIRSTVASGELVSWHVLMSMLTIVTSIHLRPIYTPQSWVNWEK